MAVNDAMVALYSTTLSGAASSVTIAGIPGSYRDLRLVSNVVSLSGSPTAQGSNIRFNGDSGSNYWTVYTYANGSSSGSGGESGTSGSWGQFPSTGGLDILEIMDYSATDKHKTAIGRSNGVSASAWMYVNRWSSTSAITSITLYSPDFGADMFAAGSTFSIYGIKA